MNKILVPVDGWKAAMQALCFGIDLARRCTGTSIELLNVEPQVESGLVRAHLSEHAIETALRGFGEDTLRPFRAFLDQTGIEYRSNIATGHLGETISRHALDSGCAEIVMGTRGLGGVEALVLGSTAYKTIHGAGVPVTVVK